MEKKSLPLIIISYLMIYSIWGSTYLFIAFAVETISAPWILAIRFLCAGLLFVFIPVLGGKIKKLPTLRELFAACFLGFFLIILGNGIITWAEKTVDSHMAALLVSTVPMLVAGFNLLFYGIKLSFVKVIGMCCGLAGVVLLLLKADGGGFSLSPGIILIIIAVISWAFGTAFLGKLKPHTNIVFHTGMQMLFAGLLCLPVAMISTSSMLPPLTGTTMLSWLSVLYLAFVGGSAIIAYNYLLKHEPVSRVTTYAFVNPLVATMLGLIFHREMGAAFLIPGMLLIFLGLFLILYLGRSGEKTLKKE